MPTPTLFGKTIALLFSKRSTRTRVSAETSAVLLGGSALFLGRDDIQFGLKESTRDSARVIGGMCQGIFARVGEHEEIEVCTGFFTMVFCALFSFGNYRNSRSIPRSQSLTRFLRCGTQHKFLPIS